MKLAIIGGVAAGTSAAAKASRVNPAAEIVLWEKGQDISYAGCGLPYYISGLSSREQVVINSPEKFQRKYGVKVKTSHEIIKIDPVKKELVYKNLVSGERGIDQYDKLIISTGAGPVIPPVSGIELKNVVPLRSLRDADRIINIIKEEKIKRVSIVGAGLIGLEMAESFAKLKLEVSLIEKMPQVLPKFSPEMAKLVEEHLREKGVKLILGDGVKSFQGEDKVKALETDSGKVVETELVLLAIGIKPEVKLAREAGVKIGPTGAIAVNKRMETSVEDIYAAGDCAESLDLLTGKPVWVPLGSTANKQGRVAGENAAGGNYEHNGVLKTAITKIFDLTAARTGLSEAEAQRAGLKAYTVTVKSVNHAAYYPELERIYLKGVFEKKTGRLLGAEIIGKAGVDKRIDVLSTALYSRLTARDLFQLDLAYAPPFSTPKDAVAVLGMLAEKKL